MVENSCQPVCLVNKLGAEVATMSDDMRAELAKGMHDWCDMYAKVVREGQEKGVIRKELDSEITGAFINDYWLGAMQRNMVQRTVAPLRTAAAFIERYLAV